MKKLGIKTKQEKYALLLNKLEKNLSQTRANREDITSKKDDAYTKMQQHVDDDPRFDSLSRQYANYEKQERILQKAENLVVAKIGTVYVQMSGIQVKDAVTQLKNVGIIGEESTDAIEDMIDEMVAVDSLALGGAKPGYAVNRPLEPWQRKLQEKIKGEKQAEQAEAQELEEKLEKKKE